MSVRPEKRKRIVRRILWDYAYVPVQREDFERLARKYGLEDALLVP